MLYILGTLLFLAIGGYIFMQQASMGGTPTAARLQRMQAAPNYKNGAFENQINTPALTEGASYIAVLGEFFNKKKRNKPARPLPSIKNDLKNLPIDSNLLVWFGHSSYYLQLDGKRFLIDPVFSGNASPIPGSMKSYPGSDIYTAEDFPSIDYLVISHDHWDHLDYQTIVQLKDKVGLVIAGLGVGAHFEHWGYAPEKIKELFWEDQLPLIPGMSITATPSRHFSGRLFKRNSTLWCSYVLKSPSLTIYLGGDSGYGPHFKAIGEQYGPFDLAILENGQYNKSWRYIHMLPEEILQAYTDLQAKALLPVHSSKFSLANHDWDEPLELLSKNAQAKNIPVLTPRIGEIVYLNQQQKFEEWWKD